MMIARLQPHGIPSQRRENHQRERTKWHATVPKGIGSANIRKYVFILTCLVVTGKQAADRPLWDGSPVPLTTAARCIGLAE